MELTCDMCSQSVQYGDDYVSHLQIVHGITKNFGFFLQKSLQNIKGARKRKAECITLEEDDEEDSKGCLQKKKSSYGGKLVILNLPPPPPRQVGKIKVGNFRKILDPLPPFKSREVLSFS